MLCDAVACSPVWFVVAFSGHAYLGSHPSGSGMCWLRDLEQMTELLVSSLVRRENVSSQGCWATRCRTPWGARGTGSGPQGTLSSHAFSSLFYLSGGVLSVTYPITVRQTRRVGPPPESP